MSLLVDGFNEETARELYAQGEEIAIFVMLQLATLAAKTTQVNGVHVHSTKGAKTQAILMSVFQTFKQCNAHVTIVNALRTFFTTKKLSALKAILEQYWLNR